MKEERLASVAVGDGGASGGRAASDRAGAGRGAGGHPRVRDGPAHSDLAGGPEPGDRVTPGSVASAPRLDVLRQRTLDFAYSSRPAEG